MELYLRKRHCPGDLVRLSAPITWEECKKTTPYPASDPGLALFNNKMRHLVRREDSVQRYSMRCLHSLNGRS